MICLEVVSIEMVCLEVVSIKVVCLEVYTEVGDSEVVVIVTTMDIDQDRGGYLLTENIVDSDIRC